MCRKYLMLTENTIKDSCDGTCWVEYPVIVSSDSICTVRQCYYWPYSTISFRDDTRAITVKETPQQIYEMLKEQEDKQ